jgi:hypothetical protein
MKRWAFVGLLAAGLFWALVPGSFAEDPPKGGSGKSLMGPKTPADYYYYQHGDPTPVMPPAKGSPGVANQPSGQSQKTAPPSKGHWGIQRVWVPGQSQEVWVWGHYDATGSWVNGHSEIRTTPGHFEERRVWIPGNY